MSYKIEKIVKLTAGTTAQTVDVRGLACLIENNSDATPVYFKERRADGKAATASNGFVLGPGQMTPLPLTAMELSVIAGAAGADVRVLILEEV